MSGKVLSKVRCKLRIFRMQYNCIAMCRNFLVPISVFLFISQICGLSFFLKLVKRVFLFILKPKKIAVYYYT